MASIPRPRTPIDETLWRDPYFVRQHGLDTNMIMHYFYLSPFYDSTSNNGQLMAQLLHNPAAAARIQSHNDFFDAMKSMRGVEYVIATGSAESGVWVIRKQLRRAGKEVVIVGKKQRVEDVSVLADYYVVGENIYQAPSIGAVLQNRVLSITRDLRKTLALVSEATSALPTTAAASPLTAVSLTSAPSSQMDPSSSIPPSSQQPSQSSSAATSTNPTQMLKDTSLLHRALLLSLRHHGEYMDDHAPLLGDPGSLLQPGAAAGGAAGAAGEKRVSTPAPSAAPTPAGARGSGLQPGLKK